MYDIEEPVQDEQGMLAAALTEVYAATATPASKFGGGSLFSTPSRDAHEIETDLGNWYPYLAPTLNKFSSLTVSLVSQVGPLDTGPIHFDGGVPVRGWAQLTLFQTGGLNFVGHFHDSGLPSYDVQFAVAVRSQLGVLYTLGRQGHMGGTFDPASRDFDWSIQEQRNVIRDDW